MKKLLSLACILLILLACGGDDDAGGGGGGATGGSEYLNVSTTNIDIAATATTATLSVTASPGCEWRITWDSNQTWIQSVTPVSGRGSQAVTITVSENKTTKENAAVLTISNSNGNIPPRTVNVRQLAGGVTLSLGSTLQTFSGDGDTQTFTVNSNTTWQVSGFNDWCHAEGSSSGTGDGSVTVKVDANTDEKARSLTLTLTASGATPIEVPVRQEAATTLRNSGESFKSVAATAGTSEFSIIGTARWSASISQITGSWARITEPSGEVTGDGRIVIAYDDNISKQSRELVVTCHWPRSSTNPVSVRLVQEAGTAPTVTTPVVSGIDRTVATLTANYESQFPVKRYGFCYTTAANKTPDLSDTVISFEGSATTGSMSTTLSNLNAGLRYYVRAYAESDVDITYSEMISFNTSGSEPGADDNPMPNPR